MNNLPVGTFLVLIIKAYLPNIYRRKKCFQGTFKRRTKRTYCVPHLFFLTSEIFRNKNICLRSHYRANGVLENQQRFRIWTCPFSHWLNNYLTKQTTNQPTDRPTKQPTDQTTDRPNTRPTDRPTNQPTNQTTNQVHKWLIIHLKLWSTDLKWVFN
jgi:hypothetical protein